MKLAAPDLSDDKLIDKILVAIQLINTLVATFPWMKAFDC
jgi:hypothetical protein